MRTAEELESISKSFDRALHSRLWGLTPASASLSWLASAVYAITFAHSAARSLISKLNLDNGDSLSSWYSDDSQKVLDICNCISSEIERLCLRCLNLSSASKLLCSHGNQSEEEICQARDLLADWEREGNGEGSGGSVESAGDVEGLIRDLAASNGMSAPRGDISPVEKVVSRAIRAVSFLTAFVARIVSSALRSSLGEVVPVHVPEEFPWGDSVCAIEVAIIVESGCVGETDGERWLFKEIDDMESRVKEQYDMEASVRHVLETIDHVAAVAASGGGGGTSGWLRNAASGLEKAAEVMSDGLSELREEVNELLLTVTTMRKEMVDAFGASERK